MTAITLRPAGRDVKIVVVDGRSIGTIHYNVVADGAIKWSARRTDGTTLRGSFLFASEAAEALASESSTSHDPAAPAAPNSEEETMTDSKTPRAEIEKRRRAAKKQAAETGGSVVRVGDEFKVVVDDETAEPTGGAPTATVVEPVVELPASDGDIVDGASLGETLRARIASAVEGVELVAAPSGAEHRVRLGKTTLAYVTPQKRSVRVHLTSVDGKPIVKVSSEAEIEAAVAAIDDARRVAS